MIILVMMIKNNRFLSLSLSLSLPMPDFYYFNFDKFWKLKPSCGAWDSGTQTTSGEANVDQCLAK